MFGTLEAILGPITVTKILVTVILILIVYYIWPLLHDPLNHIPGPPVWPLIGSLHAIDRKKGLGPSDIVLKGKYGKIFKMYEGRTPTVVIGDVNKLRLALVKDFGNFVDRRTFYFRGVFIHSLFDVGGDTWRRQRHLMTPSFTTGKLKGMQSVIRKCVDRFCDNIDKLADSEEDFETKTYTGMYTMDVIASTGFGIDLDSQSDPNNPFLVNARRIFSDFSDRHPALMVPLFAPFLIPLLEFLGLKMMKEDLVQFFARVMKPLIKERQEKPSAFVDILQLMVNSQNLADDAETKADLKEQGQTAVDASRVKKGLSDDEILAQALLLFLAGFDTTANTLSFLIYKLSQNPDIQEKLHNIITTHMDGKSLTYESVWNIPYLDQCINETLRMFPPAQRLDRKSSKDVDLDGLYIPAGTLVVVPIYMLHHDPDVWPDPYKFDPDRFSPEARASRDQFYHMPFGLGPRQCIAMRLALLEMKMLIVALLQRFRFLPSEKPLDLDLTIVMKAKTGAWVKVERR